METDDERTEETRKLSFLHRGITSTTTRSKNSDSPVANFTPPCTEHPWIDSPQQYVNKFSDSEGEMTTSPGTPWSPLTSMTPGSEMQAKRGGAYTLQQNWTLQGHMFSPQVMSRGIHTPTKSASLPSSPLFPSRSPPEPPTHTISVYNLSSTASDDDLIKLLSQFGELGTTHFEHVKTCGSATAFYFNIEHSMRALRGLQGKVFHGKILEVHYKQPVSGATEEEEMNQGTLFVHHLEKPVTKDDLKNKFKKYGEIRDVRSTPNKETHRFVEFFDTRDAKAAMEGENGTELCGNIIAIELSRPGGQFQQYTKRLKQRRKRSERRGQTSQEISPLIMATTVLDKEVLSLSGDDGLDKTQQTSTAGTHSTQHTSSIPKGGVSLLQPDADRHKVIPTAPADVKVSFKFKSHHHKKHHRQPVREDEFKAAQMQDKGCPSTDKSTRDKQHVSVEQQPTSLEDESLKSSKEEKPPSPPETHEQLQDCPRQTKHARKDYLSPTLEIIPQTPRVFITMKNWNAADPRTTLYVSNIPTMFTPEDFHTVVNNACPFGYNYLYLQREKGTSNNSGFGFINVVSTDVIPLIVHSFSDQNRALIHKGKPYTLEYAHRQSLLALLDQFDVRTLTTEEGRWLPIVLHNGKYMQLTLQLFFRMKYTLSLPTFDTWRDMHKTEESIK